MLITYSNSEIILYRNSQLVVHGTLNTRSGSKVTVVNNATIRANSWNFQSGSSVIVNNVVGALGNGQVVHFGGSHGGSGGGHRLGGSNRAPGVINGLR